MLEKMVLGTVAAKFVKCATTPAVAVATIAGVSAVAVTAIACNAAIKIAAIKAEKEEEEA